MTGSARIHLASRSPRRRELLGQIGIAFTTVVVHVDETRRPGEPPADYVVRLALEKARAGWRQARSEAVPALGADTAVVVDDEILGKPRDRAEGLAMLARLSGRTHKVMTGVAVVLGDREMQAVSITDVRFRPLRPGECAAYWKTGEPVDKAGAYAIQGFAATFVSHLAGSYSGVVGLPLYETAELLSPFGIYPLERTY